MCWGQGDVARFDHRGEIVLGPHAMTTLGDADDLVVRERLTCALRGPDHVRCTGEDVVDLVPEGVSVSPFVAADVLAEP